MRIVFTQVFTKVVFSRPVRGTSALVLSLLMLLLVITNYRDALLLLIAILSATFSLWVGPIPVSRSSIDLAQVLRLIASLLLPVFILLYLYSIFGGHIAAAPPSGVVEIVAQLTDSNHFYVEAYGRDHLHSDINHCYCNFKLQAWDTGSRSLGLILREGYIMLPPELLSLGHMNILCENSDAVFSANDRADSYINQYFPQDNYPDSGNSDCPVGRQSICLGCDGLGVAVHVTNLPDQSFYEANTTGAAQPQPKSAYLGSERVDWYFSGGDSAIKFAYLPAPWNYLRPITLPIAIATARGEGTEYIILLGLMSTLIIGWRSRRRWPRWLDGRALSPKQAAEIHETLLQAFPHRADVEQMVAFGLGENLAIITEAPNLDRAVFELLQWAIKKNRVAALLQAARAANLDNQTLQDLCLQFGIPSVSDSSK